uniref:Uncharacterized protein n=1 Tax=Populus alba TaxID=43335 RepID=A0A4U5PVG9_POPAL|nr:hypothetical protein D5086_0000173800 [Populus alba]
MIGWQRGRIQKEKDNHESALKLARWLIEKNKHLWWQSIDVVGSNKVNIKTPGLGGRGLRSEGQKGGRNPGEGGGKGGQGADPGDGGVKGGQGVDPGEGGGKGGQGQGVDPGDVGGKGGHTLFIATSNEIEDIGEGKGGQGGDPGDVGGKGGQGVDLGDVGGKGEHPLFIATSNGIEEIAKEILQKFPQGVELVNETGQNIMHVAVMHRQREIYRYVKKKFKPIMVRLSSRIDNNGYTLLHHVAHMKHYRGGTKPSPALKLQEEIQWFKVS